MALLKLVSVGALLSILLMPMEGTSQVTAVDLFPLKVGYEWKYESESVGSGYYPCGHGVDMTTVVEEGQVDGLSAFTMKSCFGSGYLRKEGDKVFQYFAQEMRWFLSLDTPVDQAIWNEFRSTSSWRSLGEIETKYLGRLRHCFQKTRQVPYTDVSVFCDGVGLVRQVMIDMQGNGWQKELVQKNF